MERSPERVVLSDQAFCRFAGGCAIAVGVGGLAYSIAFVAFLKAEGGRPAAFSSALFLLLGSLLATPVLVALYLRLRTFAPGLMLWALMIGVVASLGSAIHGAFDLANRINPPQAGLGDLPNPVDPRGFLTFGLAGLGTALIAWLIVRSEAMPRRLGLVGYVLAALLVVVYLGRLIILDPNNPLLLGAAGIAGLIVNPIWFVWLGRELRRTPDAP